MRTYSMEPGDIFRVEGPAKIDVLEGAIYAVGALYTSGSHFTVLRARRLAFKAVDKAKISVVLGPNAVLERARPEEEVLDEWESAASSVDLNGVTVVIGAIDVGKSTMTAVLANKALSRGLRVAVIDADVGQNDIGPPTTISASRIIKPITSLRQIQAEKSVFMQSTSLERIWPRAVEAIGKLVLYARQAWSADAVIVNTDGWISGEEAEEYKKTLLAKIKPNNVVAIKIGNELDGILANFSNVVFVRPPPAVGTRTKEDRKIHREMSYARFIFPVREVSVDLNKTPLCNIGLFKGLDLEGEFKAMLSRAINAKITYANQLGSALYVIADQWITRKLNSFKVFGFPEGFEKGLLVGVEDRDGFLIGLGVLKKIYYDRKKAVVYMSSRTEKALQRAACIRVGFIRLNDNFEEAERVVQLLRYDLYTYAQNGTMRGAGSA
ncbi:MAG: Clp1/GlmU family protein [Thermoproteus sp.]